MTCNKETKKKKKEMERQDRSNMMGQRLGSSPELRSNNGDSLIHLCSYAIYPYNASYYTTVEKCYRKKRGCGGLQEGICKFGNGSQKCLSQ